MKFTEIVKEAGRPIAYYPSLGELIGTDEAIFLLQLLYWTGKQEDRDGWIHKSGEQLYEEIRQQYRMQNRVRKNLVALKLIEERYVREHHRLYFRVCEDAINDLWDRADSEGMRGYRPDYKPLKGKKKYGINPSGKMDDEHLTKGSMPKPCDKTSCEHGTKRQVAPDKMSSRSNTQRVQQRPSGRRFAPPYGPKITETEDDRPAASPRERQNSSNFLTNVRRAINLRQRLKLKPFHQFEEILQVAKDAQATTDVPADLFSALFAHLWEQKHGRVSGEGYDTIVARGLSYGQPRSGSPARALLLLLAVEFNGTPAEFFEQMHKLDAVFSKTKHPWHDHQRMMREKTDREYFLWNA